LDERGAMSTTAVPSDAARRQFVEKLHQLRGSLDASERQMLDGLVQAARQAHEQGDVGVYWLSTGMSGASTQAFGDTSNIWAGYGARAPGQTPRSARLAPALSDPLELRATRWR